MASGSEVDLGGVHGDRSSDGGVAHGAKLITFTEAVMGDDDALLARERTEAHAVLGDAAFVDCCAIIASFNVVDRVADATGIPLDSSLAERSADIREELDLSRFASAANTPGARVEAKE